MRVQHLPWLLPLDCLDLSSLSLAYSLSPPYPFTWLLNLLPENKIHCWELLLSKANSLQPHDYS